jgi:hypothetical protein
MRVSELIRALATKLDPIAVERAFRELIAEGVLILDADRCIQAPTAADEKEG